jgi:hypothetical protein
MEKTSKPAKKSSKIQKTLGKVKFKEIIIPLEKSEKKELEPPRKDSGLEEEIIEAEEIIDSRQFQKFLTASGSPTLESIGGSQQQRVRFVRSERSERDLDNDSLKYDQGGKDYFSPNQADPGSGKRDYSMISEAQPLRGNDNTSRFLLKPEAPMSDRIENQAPYPEMGRPIMNPEFAQNRTKLPFEMAKEDKKYKEARF